MKKDKVKNVKVTRKIVGLIGTIVLVDSLLIGLVSFAGGHTPIYRDDKKVNMVVEDSYIDYGDSHEIEVANYYENEIEARNRVIYYKEAFMQDGKWYREVDTYYHDLKGPVSESKVVPVGKDEPTKAYIQTITYTKDEDHYYVVKETLHDELASDATLLILLGTLDATIYIAGTSIIKRENENDELKEKAM